MDFRKLVFRTGIEQAAGCVVFYDIVKYAISYRFRSYDKSNDVIDSLRNTIPIYKSN